MPHKGAYRYDRELSTSVCVRMTPTQVRSLTAMAHAMSLTVADTLRFAFDSLLEDIPEPALFAPYVRIAFGQYRLEKPRK